MKKGNVISFTNPDPEFRDHLTEILRSGCQEILATACLEKDRGVLLTFYSFPAEHWKHIRTTNPIESTFSTVRSRTDKVKSCFSSRTVVTMAYKLCCCAERRWQKINGIHQLEKIIEGVEFIDGGERVAA